MEASTQKKLPVSNKNSNLNAEASEFQQTYEQQTCSNLDNLVSSINIVVTEDISCQTDLQADTCRGCKPTYNESDALIYALKTHIDSLERQLNEKQTIIESLLKTFQTSSYNNTVTNSNHNIDRFLLQNINSPHGEMKTIDKSKLNQIDDVKSCINNDNLNQINETKVTQYINSDESIDDNKINPAKDIDKENTKQTNGSSRNHFERTNDESPPQSNKKKNSGNSRRFYYKKYS